MMSTSYAAPRRRAASRANRRATATPSEVFEHTITGTWRARSSSARSVVCESAVVPTRSGTRSFAARSVASAAPASEVKSMITLPLASVDGTEGCCNASATSPRSRRAAMRTDASPSAHAAMRDPMRPSAPFRMIATVALERVLDVVMGVFDMRELVVCCLRDGLDRDARVARRSVVVAACATRSTHVDSRARRMSAAHAHPGPKSGSLNLFCQEAFLPRPIGVQLHWPSALLRRRKVRLRHQERNYKGANHGCEEEGC